jgi:N-acetyl-1-D-myo-inositol-2-amino-2-deoxy-alpha-D-glucopyranoside deacetylase/mycothiol S-conjugate amidase
MAVLLAIGAHPDDETMLAGGTLAWAARNGIGVHILCVTRGEGGEVGEPPVTTQDQLGAVREAELRCAAERLGAGAVEFLPFEDPQMVPTTEDPAPPTALGRIAAEPEEFEAALVEVIRRVRPDVLLTHGTNGEYGHPQHVYTNQIARQAFISAGEAGKFPEAGAPFAPAALYTWAAHYPAQGDERLERLLNQDDPADWVLVLDEELIDAKEAAARCHLSQMALFLRRTKSEPLRTLLRWQESLRRVAVRSEAEDDPLAALLRSAAGTGRWVQPAEG